ncbi:MAG: DUF2461 domain-containing protein [Actinomycetales bacterium]
MGEFSLATFDFYADLEEDNSKAFWTARKGEYDSLVMQPMRDLLDGLAEEFGEAKVFRPHRDVRFSADKSPYKTHQGAYVAVGPALGWYVQVSADGLMTGGGFYAADPPHLKAFREQVTRDGSTLAELIGALPKGWQRGGEQVRTAPRGYPRDHPQIELLRHKALHVSRHYDRTLTGLRGDVLATVREDWRVVTPVVDWLDGALQA